ncbi:antibiotic biosynthesis monooxygenase family protein [Xanthovirga aplysinae]|uniref:antibiotic biosynthesis monooxygenase family protein n=1 Tax=Xanthovirga aplysinae TaxID=2529853 RepID=UPI0012BD08F1|nr:antibiotic biosynthesis monooxygenase family protein [Xanthovirga aplysinae]MTI30723.1 hypothetical protein [Xanthovirga aplysinae]
MFCVLYELHVNPENEKEFQELYPQVVEAAKNRGGLGSRLHRSVNNKELWYNYAPWPNREAWIKGSPHTPKKTDNDLVRRFRAITTPRVVYELEVIRDLLVS